MIDESSVDKRIRLQKVQVQWLDFMKTEAYKYFVDAQATEIELTQGAIIALDPIDRKDEIESYKLRGMLRAEQEFISYFEDTARRLGDAIENLLEAEKPTSTQQINNED